MIIINCNEIPQQILLRKRSINFSNQTRKKNTTEQNITRRDTNKGVTISTVSMILIILCKCGLRFRVDSSPLL